MGISATVPMAAINAPAVSDEAPKPAALKPSRVVSVGGPAM